MMKKGMRPLHYYRQDYSLPFSDDRRGTPNLG
jgi:hypothetical protein